MEVFTYKINQQPYQFTAEKSPDFRYGRNEVLSGPQTDIAFGQPWYPQGYTSVKFAEPEQFDLLRNGLTESVQRIAEGVLGRTLVGFSLEQYHHYITTDEAHFAIVSKTRDLFPEDFHFPITDFIQHFEKTLGFQLTEIDPKTQQRHHIIIRINRPLSQDYNPPHKDIYEGVDSEDSYIPLFINVWIPIAGVTPRSSLPMAAASHLLPESAILRTTEGAVVGKNKYRVRAVKEWGGSNELVRAEVGYGEVLLFSSHIVHGLAVNQEPDTTRVALEFRLFKK